MRPRSPHPLKKKPGRVGRSHPLWPFTVPLQFNYLTDAGAFRQDQRTGKFSVDFSKVKAAVAHLTHDLLMLEALGNYDGAKAMLEKLGLIRPPMQKALDHLNGIPVDINATFPQANET